MNSATVLTGTSGFTSITLVSCMVPATGTLSRMKSNGRLSYSEALMALLGPTKPMV